MKKQRQMFLWLAGAILMLFSITAKAQNPSYSMKLTNAAQVSCNMYEFDLILQRTGTTVFKLAMFQAAINVDSLIIPPGGVINVAMVPGSSTILNPAQVPTPDRFSFIAAKKCIAITSMSPPGYAAGSTITNLPTGFGGTRLCRVRVSCSLPFVVGNHAGPSWSFSMVNGYQSKVFAYVNNTNTDVTVQASHYKIGVFDPLFTGAFSAPTPQTVTSDMTQVCQNGGAGATISLSGTQNYFTYYLYVGGVAIPGNDGVIFGTGAPASFGHHVDSAGVVSVVSTSCTGTVPMLNTVTLTTLTPLSVTVHIVASPGSSVPPGTNVTVTATNVNGGTAPTYTWYVNTTAQPDTGSIFHYTPVNGDIIHVEMASSETCVTPATAQSNAVSFYVLPDTTHVTGGGSYCQGTGGLPVGLATSETGVTYTLLKGGVPQVPTVAGTGAAITFGNQLAGVYTVIGGNTAGNVPMNLSATIIEMPAVAVSVSIAPSANNLCSVVPVTFTATPVNAGSTATYQWFLNGNPVGSSQPTYTNPTPVNGDQVHVIISSDTACHTGSPYTSNNVVITVVPPHTASITLAPNQNNVCQGAAVTFTATPLFGGTTPTYQWFKNGIAIVPAVTGTTYTYQPANGDSLYVIMTSNYPCVNGSPATSNVVHMIVNPIVPVSVTAAPDQNNICSGTPVTFTATPVNGGASPTYIWHVNGTSYPTGTTPSYTFTPTNGSTVNVTMTTSLSQCFTGSPATSTTTTMVVIPILPASVTAVPSQNNVCPGTSVTFTANPVNGGTTPTYVWYLNGSEPTPAVHTPTYTFTPVNGDVVHVVMTSSLQCVSGSPYTSPNVTMVVTTFLPASVTAVPSQNNVCAGTQVTFTANPVNGGTTPTYVWYLNGSEPTPAVHTPTYTFTPANGDVVHVIMTSSLLCATGSPYTSANVTMVVNPTLPASVIAVPSQNPVCAGTQVTFTPNPTNGGTSPTYVWHKNGATSSGTGSSYIFTPVNGDIITVTMTADPTLQCVTGSPHTSAGVTMVVNPVLPASVTAVPSQNNVCAGTSVTFTANPVNGGTTPTYQWYLGSGQTVTTSTYTFTPVNGDVVHVVMTSNLACVTGSPYTSANVTMVVNPNLPFSFVLDTLTTIPSSHQICIGDTVKFTATPVNGGTSPTYQWYKNTIINVVGTNSLYKYVSPIPVTDSVWVRVTSSLTCVTGSPSFSVKTKIIVSSCTGIEELSDVSSIVIYPNPTNDKLYVDFGNLKEVPKSMKVFNALGQLCFQSDQPLMVNQKGIDVAKMSPGTYSLQIMFDKDIVTKRFIVQ